MLTYLKKSLATSVSWNYFKKRPFLGLDLGLYEIRLLQLEKRGGKFHLEKMVIYPLSFQKDLPEKKPSWEQSRQSLQALVTGMNLRKCSVALAVSSAALIQKHLEIPAPLHEHELIEILQQRLCQYFPGIPENEICFDYIVKPSPETWLSIVLIAVRKEQLQKRVSVIEQAGLKATVADVDLYALARAAALFFYPDQENSSETVGLLDLRWPVCSFIVFNAEELFFHHQWSLDRTFFEEPLDKGLHLIPFVRSGWQLYKANHPKLKIGFLGVAGELSPFKECLTLLQEHIPCEMKIVNPFQKMTHSPLLCPATILRYAPQLLLCCGLAMRGL